MGAPVTLAAAAPQPPASLAAVAVSCLLFSSMFIAGEAYVVRWKNDTLTIPKYLSRFESAEGFSLAAAKDASRFVTTSTAIPSRFEDYQPDFRGIKAAMQATNAEGQAALAKHHHQHSHHDTNHQPSPDFERQLEQLKENHGSNDQPVKQATNEEEPPVAPLSRKDDLFTPGLGVEEVSFLGPIRRPGEGAEGGADEGTEARPLDDPLQPDLLESEADVLEELKKLSGLHDAVPDPLLMRDPLRSPTTEEPPPARAVAVGGDHAEEGEGEEEEDVEEDDELEEDGEEEEGTTQDPGKDVASLEERLSASLRELAELRRRQSQKSSGVKSPALPGPYPDAESTGPYSADFSGPGAAPETVSGLAPVEERHSEALPPPRTEALLWGGGGATAPPPEWKRSGEGARGGGSSRAAMKKAHMARKLMDPEDPKKDEDLLELMLRIAENPDEWKRVHNLLRQLDDDLTTYEKTMHRVQALAIERSSPVQGAEGSREGEQGGLKEALSERDEKEARREEMSRSGLPAGSHGEAPSTTTTAASTTTQHPPQTPMMPGTLASTHHKDWPKFAYHRVTTAPHPDLFLQQHENQREGSGQGISGGTPSSHPSGHHHRNAYIAVSIIAPPSRGGGKQAVQVGRPLPSPPPVHAPPPTPARQGVHPATPGPPADGPGGEVEEETLREPMGEEEVVEEVARQESSMHHKMHADPVEEQLRALAAVEEKLRHHLHEKERMRHLLKDVGEEGTKHHRKSKRSMMEAIRHHHNQDGGHIALKAS